VCNTDSSPTIADCTFSDNVAANDQGVAEGGGMYNVDSTPVVTNCTFSHNSASGEGGGMVNIFASPTVTNCTFVGNSATSGPSYGYGGGMYNYLSSSTITNCTFLSNSAASNGGGIYNNASSPALHNCMFWRDVASLSESEIYNYDPLSTPIVTRSIVSGGYPGIGNLDVDPLLNPDLTLQLGSPAIDSGGCGSTVTATDILGNPRWDIASVPNAAGGNGVDIGAYEYQGAAGSDTIVTSFTCQ